MWNFIMTQGSCEKFCDLEGVTFGRDITFGHGQQLWEICGSKVAVKSYDMGHKIVICAHGYHKLTLKKWPWFNICVMDKGVWIILSKY